MARAESPRWQRIHEGSAYRMEEMLPFTYTPGNSPEPGSSADGKWRGGLRKFPRDLSIVLSPEGAIPGDPDSLYSLRVDHVPDPGNTSWPNNDDALLSFPESIPYDRNPSMTLWIYITFSRIPYTPSPSHGTQYFGFRIIGYNQYGQQYWSGIFIGRVNNVPSFSYRNVEMSNYIMPIYQEGWWTLKLSWSEQPATETEIWYGEQSSTVPGIMCMFLRPGRHTDLTESDLVKIDDGLSPRDGRFYPRQQLRRLDAAFLAFATPPEQSIQPLWIINRLTTSQTAKVPSVSIDREASRIIVGNTLKGVHYQLQGSDESLSAATWQVLGDFVGSESPYLYNFNVGYRQQGWHRVVTIP